MLKINIYIHNHELVAMDNGRSKIGHKEQWEVPSVFGEENNQRTCWQQYVLLMLISDMLRHRQTNQFVWK